MAVMNGVSNTRSEPRMFDPEVEEKGSQAILAALTEEEIKSMPDANMPLRHFRADKGDVSKAIKRIKYALEWRQEFNVAQIITAAHPPGDGDGSSSNSSSSSSLSEEEKDIRKILKNEASTGKLYVRNHDREDRAILYMYPAREATQHPKHNILHLVYQIERAIACTEHKSNGLEKIVIVMDFKSWKMKHASPMEVTKQTIHILQECYVERLARVYITNAPLIFRTFWKMVQVFLDPVTKAKVMFCKSSNAAHLKILRERFDWKKVEQNALPLGPGDDVGVDINHMVEFDVEDYFSSPLHTTFDEI